MLSTAIAVSGLCAFSTHAAQLEITAENQPTAESLAVSSSLTQSENGVYIVRLAEIPVAAYDGNINGFKATRPQKGKKLNPNSGAVTKYADYLTSRHDSVLNGVGGGQKLHSYKYAYNGFAAKLTGAQAAALTKTAGVLSVVADEKMPLDTITTRDMLELETGLWNELGGKANAGEDIIVGIIDSGVWPESASFTDRTGTGPNGQDGKLAYQQIPGWHGKCTPGEAFPASDCNHKLIGAQWFNGGFGGDAAVKAAFPYEYASTRDAGGHGSHTASTAAGNADAPVSINGASVGTASGMAPRARVAAYKVCWGRGNDGGCFPSDSVAAIDQAVIDGVDVLNFSISGTRTNFLDQVEVAFLFAADAGVFVAASAGNSGPDASTVAHNSPWLTTVAAGTHDRGWAADITTGAGDNYDGVSLGSGVGPADFVYSGDVTAAGADVTEGLLCYPGTLDAAGAAGKIVLCDRGAIARVDKSLAVAQAGGIGMVLANVTPGSSQNADFHSVPSIHVDVPTGDALRAYAQTAGATATIGAGSPVIEEASEVAGFSSRGPALAGEGDLLKPDIMAPGVDVIAAVAPPGNGGENYAAYSGTSMSSPHMAGLGALMKQAHPSWSPAAIKSAFMTTATQSTNLGNPIGGDAFGYGAGFVQPNSATDPGLVYDSGFNDWLAFLCGTGQLTASYCPSIAIDPSDLNYPSIAIGSLVGSQTVTRTVTNVGAAGTYTAAIDGLVGVDAVVSPASMTLAAGQSASYQITFSTTAAANVDEYTHGAVTWSDGTHNVRSPIAVRPVQLEAPAEVAGTGTEGSIDVDIKFGYAGAYSASMDGLVPAFTTGGNVSDDPANDFNTALGSCDFGSFPFACTGITWHIVPGGSGPLTRVSLFDDNTDGNDDLDLYVYDAGFAFQGGSGSGTSAEEVNISNPASPIYVVAVHGWQTDGADSNYNLFSWSPNGDAGNTSVTAPGAAVLGGTGTVTVDWTGLGAPAKYLGVLEHSDGIGAIKQTVIRVDTQ
jgi:subtilisin family serine protease